jgi:hypothetical protein
MTGSNLALCTINLDLDPFSGATIAVIEFHAWSAIE